MEKTKLTVSTWILVLLSIVACSVPNGSSGAGSNSPVAPETPAPVQETGKSLVYNFDNDVTGKLPAKFHGA